MKSGTKAFGRQVIKTGPQVANNVLSGKNVERAAVVRSKQAGKSLIRMGADGVEPGKPDKQTNRKKNIDVRLHYRTPWITQKKI